MSLTPPSINLIHLPRVTSTMDVLDDLIADGAPEWTVVVADEQTAGIGRGGRSWEARPGASLLCSILVRPRLAPVKGGMLAIAVGVAVADYLATLGVRVTLKWPNDVLLNGRKLAGILVRTRLDSAGVVANVGIGLNLTGARAENARRASLKEVNWTMPDTVDLASGIVSHLARFVHEVSTSDIRDAWLAYAAYVGESVSVEDGPRMVAGLLVGIDDRGALVIQGEGGERHAVTVGDLVRGPRAGSG